MEYICWTLWMDSRGKYHARQFGGVTMNTNSHKGICNMIDNKIKSQQGEWIK